MTVPILETTDVICSSLYLRAAQDRINHYEGKQWCVCVSLLRLPNPGAPEHTLDATNLFTKTNQSAMQPNRMKAVVGPCLGPSRSRLLPVQRWFSRSNACRQQPRVGVLPKIQRLSRRSKGMCGVIPRCRKDVRGLDLVQHCEPRPCNPWAREQALRLSRAEAKASQPKMERSRGL
jgi:hypothetical protein